MAKDSMIIYRSIAEALSELPSDQYQAMMTAVFNYAFDDIDPEFEDAACRMAWRLIKPQLDACVRKYEAQVANGQKGGRPKTQINPTETQKNPNKPNGNPTETLNDKCKMLNDKCLKSSNGLMDITRARVREDDDDFEDDGWDPDRLITTTDGTQIRLGDVHFGNTVKLGVKPVAAVPNNNRQPPLTDEEKERILKRLDDFKKRQAQAGRG